MIFKNKIFRNKFDKKICKTFIYTANYKSL